MSGEKVEKEELFSVPAALLRRLPKYYNYLRRLQAHGEFYVSSVAMADDLGQSSVQVRKELAMLSSTPGKSRKGFEVNQLLKDIEIFLGYDNKTDVALVGVGNLGKALLCHNGFVSCGLDIVVAFDVNKSLQGTSVNNKKILPVGKITDLVSRLGIRLAIIATPPSAAQSVCDKLVKGGVHGILNLTATHLVVPKDVIVQDSDIAMIMSILSKRV